MRNNEERISARNIQQDSTPPVNSVGLQLNFIAPTEFVDLPSKGLFYPEGHPLKNKSTIEIKQMTAKEEDILTNRSFLKKGIALDKLLESIVLDKSVDTGELLVCDRNAILVAARISGYGPEYLTQVVCPSCEKKTKNKFDLQEKLEEAETKEIDVEIDQQGLFTIQLPLTKWNVKCRPLNGSDEKRLISLTMNKTKEEFTLIDQLKMLIVSIEGTTDKDLLNKAIEVMPAIDSKFLRRKYDSIIPSLNLKSTFVCGGCEHEEVMEVPLTADFFWPK